MPDEISAEITVAESSGSKCVNCNGLLRDSDRFCRKCGVTQAVAEETDLVSRKRNAIQQLILFFIIGTIICAASLIKTLGTFNWMVAREVVLAIVTIVFVTLNWQACRPLLVWNNFSLQHVAFYCSSAMAASCVVYFAGEWINEHLFNKRLSYYAYFSEYKHGAVALVFFIAVTPAIFEELAFRVFLLGKLLIITEKNQAAIISGFMFAIVHMSFISLYWLIPAGVVLGYVRIRTNTMWYGSCIHFCFNLTACLIDIIEFNRFH